MAPNDLIALRSNFDTWQKTRGAGLTDVTPFNYYCVENFLKAYPVNDKEIRTGIVDQSMDGGTDAFYFFANRKYVFEDTSLDQEAEYRVNLVIFQCKEGSGFSPIEMGKFIFFTEDVLDLSRQESEYKSLYHDRLKKLMAVFKEQFASIAGSVTSFTIEYFYISKLDVSEPKPDSDVATYEARLRKTVREHFPKADCKIEFVNAAKLFAQASIRKTKTKKLTYSSQTIQSSEGWIGLVDLRALYTFLQDEAGDFQEGMLEENVRGFQNKTLVNDAIAATLREPLKSAEFWVLNNGITILCDKLDPAGMAALLIKDPQIVNGLQTSRSVFDYYKSIAGGAESDKRKILVRVIETNDEQVRDQIIRATNSQNRMPPEALRATDPIHRKIEEVFAGYGLFYDRRKGHYKDMGKPAAKIVSVRDVLQATLAIALRRPNDARGRPADYLKEDDKYMEVFGDNKFHIPIYRVCTELLRKVEAVKPSTVFQPHILNLMFYASLCIAARKLNNAHIPSALLANLDVGKISETEIQHAYAEVLPHYSKFGGNDKAAKGTDFRDALVAHLETSIHGAA